MLLGAQQFSSQAVRSTETVYVPEGQKPSSQQSRRATERFFRQDTPVPRCNAEQKVLLLTTAAHFVSREEEEIFQVKKGSFHLEGDQKGRDSSFPA